MPDLVNQLSAFESVCGHDTLTAAIKHVEKEASIGGWDASALVQSLSNHQRIWACFNQTDASGKLEDPEEGCARSFFDRYSLTAADENCGTDEAGPAAAAAIRTLFSYFTIIAALHTSHVNERSAPGPLVSRLNLATYSAATNGGVLIARPPARRRSRDRHCGCRPSPSR